jgi:hypothetical protein
MTKIIFNPKVCQDFVAQNQPAHITVSSINVLFNKGASAQLAVTKGSRFTIELDGHDLFYTDSTTDGFEIKADLKQGMVAPARGLLRLLIKHQNLQETTSINYTVGEFADGRRKLTPMPTRK